MKRIWVLLILLGLIATQAHARTLVIVASPGGSFGSASGFAEGLGLAMVRDGLGRYYGQILKYRGILSGEFRQLAEDLALRGEETDIFFLAHGWEGGMDGVDVRDFLALKGKHTIRFIYSTGCWNGGTWINGRLVESRLVSAFRIIGVRSWVLHAGENTSGGIFLPRFIRLLAGGMAVQNAARLAFDHYLKGYDLYRPIAFTEFINTDPYGPDHDSCVLWEGENLNLSGKTESPLALLEPPMQPRGEPLPVDSQSDHINDLLSGAIEFVRPVSGKQAMEAILGLFLDTFQEVYPRLSGQADSACLPGPAIKKFLEEMPQPVRSAAAPLAPRWLCIVKKEKHAFQILWRLDPTWQREVAREAGISPGTPDIRKFLWQEPIPYKPYGISMETQGAWR